jgi:predicted transposase YbfD/YdcC
MSGMADWVKLRGEKLVAILDLSRSTLPHQTTYERVLEELEVDHFEALVGAFLPSNGCRSPSHSMANLTGHDPLVRHKGASAGGHVPQQGVVWMQVEVDGKDNEITAAPRLLAALDLRHCVVTGDAIFTQRDICDQIVLAGGDYVFPVKANQPKLLQAIQAVFTPAPVTAGHSRVCLPEDSAKTIHSGHGRIETRYLTTSSQLNAYLDWPHLGQVFRLQRLVQHQKTGQLAYDVVFGITSLSAEHCSPERLMGLVRDHWHIENRLHYVRDVTFHEDDCRIRQPKRQRFLASLNNLVIGLIRQGDFDYVPQARRFFSVHYPDALRLLL